MNAHVKTRIYDGQAFNWLVRDEKVFLHLYHYVSLKTSGRAEARISPKWVKVVYILYRVVSECTFLFFARAPSQYELSKLI